MLPSYNDMAGGVAGRGRMCLRRTGGDGRDIGRSTGDGIGGGGESQRVEGNIVGRCLEGAVRNAASRTRFINHHQGTVQISMLFATVTVRVSRYPTPSGRIPAYLLPRRNHCIWRFVHLLTLRSASTRSRLSSPGKTCIGRARLVRSGPLATSTSLRAITPDHITGRVNH